MITDDGHARQRFEKLYGSNAEAGAAETLVFNWLGTTNSKPALNEVSARLFISRAVDTLDGSPALLMTPS
jgi:hypothetical protein